MNAKKTPTELKEKFVVRFDDGQRDRLHQYAARNRRSMNTMIVMALEEAMKADEAKAKKAKA